MKSLVKHFLQGCLVITPVAATAYVLYKLFVLVDGLLPTRVPGLGIVATLAAITALGFLTANVVGRRAVGLLEGLLTRLPLVRLVYTSIRDVTSAFLGEKKSFDRPVAVALVPGSAARALGFVTREALGLPGFDGHVAVYFPQSYHFAGSVLLVPRAQIEPLAIEGSELMAFVISGGLSGATGATAEGATGRV